MPSRRTHWGVSDWVCASKLVHTSAVVSSGVRAYAGSHRFAHWHCFPCNCGCVYSVQSTDRKSGTHTLSPFSNLVTPSPTSSTVPAMSSLRTVGYCSTRMPKDWTSQSNGPSATDSTLTRISRGPGLGVGTDFKTKSACFSGMTSAL